MKSQILHGPWLVSLVHAEKWVKYWFGPYPMRILIKGSENADGEHEFSAKLQDGQQPKTFPEIRVAGREWSLGFQGRIIDKQKHGWDSFEFKSVKSFDAVTGLNVTLSTSYPWEWTADESRVAPILRCICEDPTIKPHPVEKLELTYPGRGKKGSWKRRFLTDHLP